MTAGGAPFVRRPLVTTTPTSAALLVVASALSISALIACTGRSERSQVGLRGVPVAADCVSTRSGVAFFPEGAFKNADYDGWGSRREYSLLLLRMREPPLFCGNVVSEAYRVIQLNAVLRSNAVVRISHKRDAFSIAGSRVTHREEQPPLEDYLERPMSRIDWKKYEAAIEHVGFWTIEAPSTRAVDSEILDGSTWILEGRKNSFYRVLLGSADIAREKELIAAFNQLLMAAGWESTSAIK